jgi:hypothetical protein
MCYQNNEVEAFSVGPLTVTIMYDHDPMDPRKEYDNVGRMICFHPRYNLGDEQPSCSPDEYLMGLLSQETQDIVERCEAAIDNTPSDLGQDYVWRPVLRYRNRYAKLLDIKKRAIEGDLEKNYVILPLYLYDHSGITMSTGAFSCPWDSGEIGFIYVSMERAREEWGHGDASDEEIRARAEKYLEGEVETYDAYISGQVYGYRIVETFGEDEDEDEGGEELDSCWGFFGLDYCREEARSNAEYYASKIPVQLALELTD